MQMGNPNVSGQQYDNRGATGVRKGRSVAGLQGGKVCQVTLPPCHFATLPLRHQQFQIGSGKRYPLPK